MPKKGSKPPYKPKIEYRYTVYNLALSVTSNPNLRKEKKEVKE